MREINRVKMYQFRKWVLGVLILLFITGCADAYLNENGMRDSGTDKVDEQYIYIINENGFNRKVRCLTFLKPSLTSFSFGVISASSFPSY